MIFQCEILSRFVIVLHLLYKISPVGFGYSRFVLLCDFPVGEQAFGWKHSEEFSHAILWSPFGSNVVILSNWWLLVIVFELPAVDGGIKGDFQRVLTLCIVAKLETLDKLVESLQSVIRMEIRVKNKVLVVVAIRQLGLALVKFRCLWSRFVVEFRLDLFFRQVCVLDMRVVYLRRQMYCTFTYIFSFIWSLCNINLSLSISYNFNIWLCFM